MTSTSYVAFTSIRDQVPGGERRRGVHRNATSVVVNGEQQEVRSMTVSEEYFDLLGVSPMMGPGIHATRGFVDSVATRGGELLRSGDRVCQAIATSSAAVSASTASSIPWRA